MNGRWSRWSGGTAVGGLLGRIQEGAAERGRVIPQMRWRIALILGAAVFGSLAWATAPYWDSVMRSEDSPRGRMARAERVQDTVSKAIGRASRGAVVGFACGLLSLTVRSSGDYRNNPDRQLHWTGLEIRRRKPRGGGTGAG